MKGTGFRRPIYGRNHAAVVATEQNDNRFDVYLEVNGDNQISQEVVTAGYVGETRDLGSFFTW